MARLRELPNLVYSCLTWELHLDARSPSFVLYLRSSPNCTKVVNSYANVHKLLTKRAWLAAAFAIRG